ncbi:MAG: hypothetical protein R2844_10880 [Caldilineales bacterium]
MVADCILVARDLGAPALGGVTYSALTRYWEPPAEGSRQRVLETISAWPRRPKLPGSAWASNR